jgi:multidrug/hemolysin transport system permease protein
MKTLSAVIRRNVALFFKDKGMLFTSLITPMILLVLYTTFLGNVYRDAFVSAFPEGMPLSDAVERAIDGCVGGQLLSSLLAVSCVTVAFCSNLLMVQDKVTGARADLTIAPVKPSLLALGYYISTALVTCIICLVALGAGLGYLGAIGFYLSALDVLMLVLDVLLLVLFGTALSSIVNYFLSSQGQISAVGTIVSSGYGFICGAYMPISSFGEGLQTALSFLPGTYATSLMRNHAMRGAMDEMVAEGLPEQMIEGLRDAVDCNVYFFGKAVSEGAMLAIVGATVALLMLVYLLMNLKNKKHVR